MRFFELDGQISLRAVAALLSLSIALPACAASPVLLWFNLSTDTGLYSSADSACASFNGGATSCFWVNPDPKAVPGAKNYPEKYLYPQLQFPNPFVNQSVATATCMIWYEPACDGWQSNGYPAPPDPFKNGWMLANVYCPAGQPQVPGTNRCGGTNSPGLAKGHCASCEFDPINALVGNKYEVERDYSGSGAFPLVFERVYNSWGAGPGAAMGFYPEYLEPTLAGTSGSLSPTLFTPVAGLPTTPITDPSTGSVSASAFVGLPTNSLIDASWRHSYDRTLQVAIGVSASTATLFRADSKTRTFTATNGVWTADPGQLLTVLTQHVDGSGNTLGWTYLNENDETEQYDPNGKLLSITNRAGLTQSLQYNTHGALASITDSFGRQITLTYNSQGSLSVMADPNGGNYTYTYTTDGHNNLSTITYPDGHMRQYVYENVTYPTALTGIIDENGNRFATWEYDSFGNAVMSQNAGGVGKGTLTFPSATSSTASDANGTTRSYTTQMVNNIPMAGTVTESWNGGSRTKSMSYDVDGNMSSRTDYNGNVTTYSYDLTRDLETSRTEAAGSAQARTISTQWHPTFRLPTQIVEPGRTSTFTYDRKGNLLSKTIAAGASSRTWTYTYNANGQILTVTGPRSDVSDVTTYAYDGSGNLVTVTNAIGQVTSLSNYDSNGRVGLITDPNGATTALTYAPRGWLTNKIVTAGSTVQSTTYSYDNVGQLTQVTLPDGSTVSYTYDNAHRLTNVKDSLGDSINYTLDSMDNRIAETVTDPNGVLTRQISRIFDAVNRLTQVTGAAQ